MADVTCNALPIRGKVQEEELDSCRAAGERGPVARQDEGAGRNQQGFSLPFLRGMKMRNGDLPSLSIVFARQLSLWLWRWVARSS
jgi:hypothetical protein